MAFGFLSTSLMGNATYYQKDCIHYIVLTSYAIFSTSWQIPIEPADAFRYIALWSLVGIYGFTFLWLGRSEFAKRDARLEKEKSPQEGDSKARMEKACNEAYKCREQPVTGLTPTWYKNQQKCIPRTKDVVYVLGAAYALHLIVVSYPESPLDYIITTLESLFNYFKDQGYSDFNLFVWGTWIGFEVGYWSLTAFYVGYLDFCRPEWAIPYKVQESFHLTWSDFVNCMKVTGVNQLILLGCIAALYYPYSYFPNAFSPKLPSLVDIVFQIIPLQAVEELWFYWAHYTMHKYNWLYNNIHYMHHEFKAPIAPAAIYAHPIEMVIVNFPTAFFGPAIVGMHCVLFWVGAPIGLFSTMNSHSGWALPMFPSPTNHDYHHYQGYDNIGCGIFDYIMKTNLNWEKSWQRKTDMAKLQTPDYPVDLRRS